MRATSLQPALLQKHSIVIGDTRTSVSLETRFWIALKQIAARQSRSVSAIVVEIAAECGRGNLSSAIRLYVLDDYEARLS